MPHFKTQQLSRLSAAEESLRIVRKLYPWREFKFLPLGLQKFRRLRAWGWTIEEIREEYIRQCNSPRAQEDFKWGLDQWEKLEHTNYGRGGLNGTELPL